MVNYRFKHDTDKRKATVYLDDKSDVLICRGVVLTGMSRSELIRRAIKAWLPQSGLLSSSEEAPSDD